MQPETADGTAGSKRDVGGQPRWMCGIKVMGFAGAYRSGWSAPSLQHRPRLQTQPPLPHSSLAPTRSSRLRIARRCCEVSAARAPASCVSYCEQDGLGEGVLVALLKGVFLQRIDRVF